MDTRKIGRWAAWATFGQLTETQCTAVDPPVPIGAPYEFCKTCRDAWPGPSTKHECPDRVRRGNCAHNVPLLSGECADCTGPMTDAELDLIRQRLAGHEGCVPRCDHAPSEETARLLATIDALRDASEEAGERDPLRKLTTIEVLRDENSALRSENAALRTDVNEVRLYTGADATAQGIVAELGDVMVKANAEGLYEGAKSMRDACAAMAREAAKSGNTAMAMCAAAIATAIESLPLPPK